MGMRWCIAAVVVAATVMTILSLMKVKQFARARDVEADRLRRRWHR